MDFHIPTHSCNANHEGSSESMEANLARMLTEKVHGAISRGVSIGTMVTGDDSTLRKHGSLIANGDRLKEGVYKPKFLTDPEHG